MTYPKLDDLLGQSESELGEHVVFIADAVCEMSKWRPRSTVEAIEQYQAAYDLDRFARDVRRAVHHARKRRAGSARAELLWSFFGIGALILCLLAT